MGHMQLLDSPSYAERGHTHNTPAGGCMQKHKGIVFTDKNEI